MRYKVAPAPVDRDLLGSVHGAVPLVPEDVADCCARVVDRTAIGARADAREWIAFLDALGLAERTPHGYERVRTDPESADLSEAYAERVFGVDELLAADGPLTAEGAFERLAPAVPEWERDRHADWERVWRDRTRRLLEWAVAFGLLTREGEAYRRPE